MTKLRKDRDQIVKQRRISILKRHALIPVRKPFRIAVNRREAMLANVAGQREISPFNRSAGVCVFKTEPGAGNPVVGTQQDCQNPRKFCGCENKLSPGSLDLYQLRFVPGRHGGFNRLRISPEVHHRGLVYAAHCAVRSATLLGFILPADIFEAIVGNRRARESTLLRTIVDKTFFTNIEVPGTGPALPVVRFTVSNLFLKLIQSRVALL